MSTPTQSILQRLSVGLTLGLLASSAGAQGFNVDFGNQGFYPLPSNGYGAAAGQTGTWNAVATGQSIGLVDVAGNATNVVFSEIGASNDLGIDSPNTTGDDENLLDDGLNIGAVGALSTITITGLANGSYDVYTYAWAPDLPLVYCTDVDVVGSPSGLQSVCGDFLGTHILGATHALHIVTVTNGSITITATANVTGTFGTLNGVQVKPSGSSSSGSAYCFGDATGASCPCSAFGAPGEGCMTTSGSGATLAGSGNASVGADSLILSVSGAPANKPGLFFQGTNMVSVPAGDGILCSNANLRYSVNSTDAAGVVTQTGFGANASPGQTLNYQYWFRDPANPCGMGGFNFTNGWVETWN